MARANIHDRQSIERVYPHDAFARDAARNDRHRVEHVYGVRIASGPDEHGDFMLEPAAQYAGEAPGAVFLAPFHRFTGQEGAATDPDPRRGYDAFLDQIIEAARQRGFRPALSPGPGDPRLRGERQ